MFNALEKSLAAEGYTATPITPDNFPKAYEVYAANQPFFLLTDGQETTPETSRNDLTALPPNCTPDQKLYFTIQKDNHPLAVCDIILNFPEKQTFWLGLLLIHATHQNQSLGSHFLSHILQAAKISGYITAQLGVIDINTRAAAFWQKHGFTIQRQSGNIVVMTRNLV